MHRNTTSRSSDPFNMRGALTFAIYAAVLCIAGATSGSSDQHVTDAAAAAGRRSLLREGSGHHRSQQGHSIVADAEASMTLSQKLAHHLRQGRKMIENVFAHDYDDTDDANKILFGQKGYCGSVNPNKDCTGKKNAKNNNSNNNSGSGENNGDSSTSSSDIGVSDVAKAIMSVVKDSKDKSIDLKKLRDKVQDELDVSSDDSDEFDDFKDKFKDALDKLEGKDLIKIKDGVVSAVISGDDSQDEKKKDKDKGDDDDEDDDDDDGKKDKDPDSSGGDDGDDNEKNPNKPSGDDDDDGNGDGNGDKPNGDSTTDTGKGAIGAECQRNRDCESSMCSDGVCAEKMSGIGEECASDSDCESGICGSQGTCEESRTDDGDTPASTTKSEPTTSPTMDAAPTMPVASPGDTIITDKGAIGDACEKDRDCKSNLCVDSLCSAELKENGEDCQADTECQSDFCSSAGVCDNISNDTEGMPTSAPPPETNPAPAPAPSGSGDDDDDDSRDGPSRPDEVESYSGDLSIPYNFQISTEGGELTPEDIADIEEALDILSQQIIQETFPDDGAGGRRLRQALKLSVSSRHLLVVYNENDPAEVTDAQQAGMFLLSHLLDVLYVLSIFRSYIYLFLIPSFSCLLPFFAFHLSTECVLSTDPGPCYDVDAETTLTLVDEDRGTVRDEFRDAMEEAIADGLLNNILREINPDTTLTATVIPSDGNVDESRAPEGGTDPAPSSTNLSPGGIAGIAIAAAGVTAAVAFAIVAGRRRNNDDDERSDLDSSNDGSPRDPATGFKEDASLRRLRAAAAAAGSTQRPGVYPDSYHQDAAHMASSRKLNPDLQEDENLGSDDDEPTGAPGSFPTEAPPAPTDNASTPLIAAAAVAGGAALAAQHQGIIDESSTDQSMYEDDTQLEDSYDEAIDAHIRSTHEDADVNQILNALPGAPAGADKDGESPDSSFEDDIRAAITSMEGEDHVRDVSPERELPDSQYSSASDEPESEKEVDAKKEKKSSPGGLAGLIRKLSSQNMGGSED